MRFREHGQFDIETIDNVVIVDAKGPFNKEVIPLYRQAMKDAIASFSGQKWQQIIVIRETSLFTPEAEKALLKTLAYRKSLGLNASAVVMLDCDAVALTKQQLTRCYNRYDIEHDFFDSIEEAKQWLANL